MRLLTILMILFSYPLFCLDITHYESEFAQISGIFESDKHGLIIASFNGVYKVDKASKSFELIPFKGQSQAVAFEYFFEYNDEIYCYKEEGSLYRIRDGKLDSVSSLWHRSL